MSIDKKSYYAKYTLLLHHIEVSQILISNLSLLGDISVKFNIKIPIILTTSMTNCISVNISWNYNFTVIFIAFQQFLTEKWVNLTSDIQIDAEKVYYLQIFLFSSLFTLVQSLSNILVSFSSFQNKKEANILV